MADYYLKLASAEEVEQHRRWHVGELEPCDEIRHIQALQRVKLITVPPTIDLAALMPLLRQAKSAYEKHLLRGHLTDWSADLATWWDEAPPGIRALVETP